MPETAPYIEITSGVSAFTGEPFCLVVFSDPSTGQLSPQQVRDMAMGWLAAAEAAESDAAVFAQLTQDLGLSPDVAGQFIGALRHRRDEGGP